MVEAAAVASPVSLSPADERRAQELHRRAIVFYCHDHLLFPEQLEAMAAGGVTAKQLMLAVDARIHADQATFMSSGQARGYDRYLRRRHTTASPVATSAVAIPAAEDDLRVAPLGAAESEGFLKSAIVAFDYVHWQVEQSKGRLRIALTPDDIEAAKRDGATALLLGSEGSRLIEDRLEVLRMLYKLGLRHLQLSWALETTVGAPQAVTSGRGLTDFGRDLIREMNRIGVIVDVSHLAVQSQVDALAVSTTPVLNSHTGASALNNTQPQLLDDDLIRAFAAQGGVMAMHFHSQLVKPGRDKATFGQLMDQFEYVARLAGTDHVACGPDFMEMRDDRIWKNQGIPSPFTLAEGVEDVSLMGNVTRGLVQRGFSDTDVLGILGGNLLRLFRAVHDARNASDWAYPRPAEFGAATGGVTPL